MSTLCVVATPIGNMEDITQRAVSVLKEADFILCEDTRVTKKLLDRHGIIKPTMSYHAHSGIGRIEEIIDALKEGKNLALVSDAGTPGISDPGAELVSRIRNELADMIATGDLKIEAVPGPSAFVAALSIAGVPCSSFTFLGFLPHKKGRKTLFEEIARSERTTVFYESPHRLLKALESLSDVLSASDERRKEKKVTVCKELTKIFEETVRGTAKEVLAYFHDHLEKVRGEFVIIVSESK